MSDFYRSVIPTTGLRWYRGVLQQAYSETISDGRMRFIWQDVPVVSDTDLGTQEYVELPKRAAE